MAWTIGSASASGRVSAPEAIERYLVAPRKAGRVKTHLIKKLLAALNAAPEKVMFPAGAGSLSWSGFRLQHHAKTREAIYRYDSISEEVKIC